jgi:hypothetical protein
MKTHLLIGILILLTTSFAHAKKAKGDKACTMPTTESPISYCFFESDIVANQEMIEEELKIKTQFQWVDLEEIPQRLIDLFNLDNSKDPESKALLSHSNYLIKANIETFNANFFLNTRVMNSLTGMEYTQTDVKNVFKVRFDPGIIFAPVLLSTVTLSFPTDNRAYSELKSVNNSSFIIISSGRDFNEEVYQSDIITSFTREGENVRVETLALGHITDTSFGAFSFKSKIKAREMLKALKRQTPIARSVYIEQNKINN